MIKEEKYKCYKRKECNTLLTVLEAHCNGKLVYDGQGHSALCPIRLIKKYENKK